MTVLLLVFRIAATIVLIPLLTVFIGLYSVIQNVNSDNYETFLDEITEEILIKEVDINANNSAQLDLNASHAALIASCSGKMDIVLQSINITSNCSKITNSGTTNIDNIIRNDLEEYLLIEFDKRSTQSRADYFGFEYDSLKFYFETIGMVVLVLGFSTVSVIIIIIFLSFPKYQLATYLGLGGLISGIPALFIDNADFSYLYGDIVSLQAIVENISMNLYQNFLVILLSGFAMVSVGLIWTITTRFGILSMKKRVSRQLKETPEVFNKSRKRTILKSDIEEIKDIKGEGDEGLPDLDI